MPGRESQNDRLPDDTARAAKSSFNFNNLYLLIGDQLDQLYAEFDLAQLDPASEKPVSIVSMYALVTIFQFAEGLPDRQAAEATRTRMDWKYALHLPLSYPGLDPQALCQFRQRLWLNPSGQALLELLCGRIAGLGLFSQHESADCNARTLLKAVCTANRLDLLEQAFHLALEAVAAQEPEWLRSITRAYWYLRYSGADTQDQQTPARLDTITRVSTLREDARYLLEAWCAYKPPAERTLPEMRALGQVFDDQFEPADRSGGYAGLFNWRLERCASCGAARQPLDRPGSPRR